MRKADYTILARRINEARQFQLNPTTQRPLSPLHERAHLALGELAKQLAIDLAVDRIEFLKACGMKLDNLAQRAYQPSKG